MRRGKRWTRGTRGLWHGMRGTRAGKPPATTSRRTPLSELAKALAKFHTDLPEVKKDATNPHFGSKYADLADIVKVVLPKLAAVGLTWIATPTMTEDGFVLAYELRHETGEKVEGAWPLPDPERAKPQELG